MKKVIRNSQLILLLLCICSLSYSQDKGTENKQDTTAKHEIKELRRKNREEVQKSRIERRHKRKLYKYKAERDTICISNVGKKSSPAYAFYNNEVVLELSEINTFLYDISLVEIQKDWISKETSEKKMVFHYTEPDFKIDELILDTLTLLSFNRKNSISFDLDKLKTRLRLKESSLDSLECKKKLCKNEVATSFTKFQFEKQNLESEREKLKNEIEFFGDKKKQSLNQNEDSDSTLLKLKNQLKEKNISYDSLVDTSRKLKKNQELISLNLDKKIVEAMYDTLQLKKEINFQTNHNNGDQNEDKIKVDFNKHVKMYKKSISDLIKLKNYYHQLLFLLYSNKDFSEIDSQKRSITKIFFNKENMPDKEGVISNCYKRLDDVKSNFSKIESFCAVNQGVAEVRKSFKKIKAFHFKIDFQKQDQFIQEIQKIYDKIDKKNWTVYFQTTDINPKADNIYYQMNAIPRVNKYNTVTQSISRNYNLPIEGGIKIDVSAGMFFNVGLKDDEYRFEEMNENTTRVKKVKTSDQFIPQVGVLFNFYRRSVSNIKLAGSFGAATDSEKINYYLGSSLIIGKNERIIFTSGIVGGQVNRIAREYSENETINKPISELPSEILYRKNDPFKIGWFFGITYNLSGKNKETAKKIFK